MKRPIIQALVLINICLTSEMPNAQIMFSDGFEIGNLQNSITSTGKYKTAMNVSVSEERSKTGFYSLRYYFRGSSNLDEDAWGEHRINLGEKLKEVWIR